MTDVPPDPKPVRDVDIPAPAPVEVPDQGGFHNGDVEIEEPLEDEMPPQ